MKLNVEIDSGAFEKVIADGIKALSPEDLGAIIKQVVYEAFTKCEEFKDLLMKRTSVGWSGSGELVLGKLAEQAVVSVANEMDAELAPFKEKMVKSLMENHQEIVEGMLLRLLAEKVAYSDSLRDAMRDVVYEILNREKNNGNL